MKARWGHACVAYYALNVEYFMSPSTSSLMSVLARGYMWTRVLSGTPTLEKETLERLPNRLQKAAELFGPAERAVSALSTASALGVSSAWGSGGGGKGALGGGATLSLATDAPNQTEAALGAALSVGATGPIADVALTLSELAGESLRAQATQSVKVKLFCGCHGVVPLGAPTAHADAVAAAEHNSLAVALEISAAQAVCESGGKT